MLGALGGISLVAMLLSARVRAWLPVVIWAISTALMAGFEFGVVP